MKRRAHQFTDYYDTQSDLKSFHLDRYFFSDGTISFSVSPSFFYESQEQKRSTKSRAWVGNKFDEYDDIYNAKKGSQHT